MGPLERALRSHMVRRGLADLDELVDAMRDTYKGPGRRLFDAFCVKRTFRVAESFEGVDPRYFACLRGG